jgi:hypothetical protein
MPELKISAGLPLTPEGKKLITEFSAWCYKKLGLSTPCSIICCKKGEYPGISTGGYDPQNHNVISRLQDRHPLDVIRTIAHELVHLRQRELGYFDEQGNLKDGTRVQNIGGPVENEANAASGILVKQFADEFGAWIYQF